MNHLYDLIRARMPGADRPFALLAGERRYSYGDVRDVRPASRWAGVDADHSRNVRRKHWQHRAGAAAQVGNDPVAWQQADEGAWHERPSEQLLAQPVPFPR